MSESISTAAPAAPASDAAPASAERVSDPKAGHAASSDPAAKPGGQASDKAGAVEGEGGGVAPVIPEKYKFTAPDGFEVNAEQLGGWEAHAREAGLTQAQFDAASRFGIDFVQKHLGHQAQQRDDTQRAWRDEVLADRTLTDGRALRPEIHSGIARVINEFGGDDLRRALDETGMGNHPALVRAFAKLAQAQDRAGPPDTGRTTGSAPRDRSFESVAGRLYPKAS